MRHLSAHAISVPDPNRQRHFCSSTSLLDVMLFRISTEMGVWCPSALPDMTEGFLTVTKKDMEYNLEALEIFVVYNPTSNTLSINESHRKLFSRKGKQLESIPPSQDDLYQHCCRAVYQGEYVWKHTLKTSQLSCTEVFVMNLLLKYKFHYYIITFEWMICSQWYLNIF